MKIPWEMESVVKAIGSSGIPSRARGDANNFELPLGDGAKFVFNRVDGEVFEGSLVNEDGSQLSYPDQITQYDGLAVKDFLYVYHR